MSIQIYKPTMLARYKNLMRIGIVNRKLCFVMFEKCKNEIKIFIYSISRGLLN